MATIKILFWTEDSGQEIVYVLLTSSMINNKITLQKRAQIQTG